MPCYVSLREYCRWPWCLLLLHGRLSSGWCSRLHLRRRSRLQTRVPGGSREPVSNKRDDANRNTNTFADANGSFDTVERSGGNRCSCDACCYRCGGDAGTAAAVRYTNGSTSADAYCCVLGGAARDRSAPDIKPVQRRAVTELVDPSTWPASPRVHKPVQG